MPYDVLHILQTAQPQCTSFARFVSALAIGLDPDRYRLHAWFLTEDGPLAPHLQALGVRVRILHWRGARRDPAGIVRFWNAVREQDWSIIHLHSWGIAINCIARLASHAAVVAHIWAPERETEGPAPVPRLIWDADAVIACSRAAAEVAVGVRPYIIYPGVQVPKESEHRAVPRQEPGLIVGTARRLVPIKGIIYLIRAMKLLREQVPGALLEIAGSGPEQSKLESEARRLGLADRIRFLGWQADIESLLRRWDIFVMPSLQEGFGIAALEAMAAGLPVVASNVGGIPELVENGRTGWLVPPQNPEALAERLRSLLLHPDERRRMGAAGRARAEERFSVDRMVAGISAIYDGIVGVNEGNT